MTKEFENVNKLMLKNSIRLLIGGWLYDGGDIDKVIEILKEVAQDYSEEIKKVIHEHRS